MRKPDVIETQSWYGRDVEIRAWCEPTDIPWEDCHDDSVCEREGSEEGWDLYVEANLTHAGQSFTGRASLGSIWILPDSAGRAHIDTQQSELIQEALDALRTEIQAVIDGRDIKAAKQRAIVARGLFS